MITEAPHSRFSWGGSPKQGILEHPIQCWGSLEQDWKSLTPGGCTFISFPLWSLPPFSPQVRSLIDLPSIYVYDNSFLRKNLCSKGIFSALKSKCSGAKGSLVLLAYQSNATPFSLFPQHTVHSVRQMDFVCFTASSHTAPPLPFLCGISLSQLKYE